MTGKKNPKLFLANGMRQDAEVQAPGLVSLGGLGMSTRYQVECRDRSGRLVWKEDFHNLVVTVGLNKVLDAAFKTGLTTPAWYIGLVDNASFSAYAAGDIMSSHAGWIESTIYSQATRVAWTPGSIAGGSVDNSGAVATFSINGSGDLKGCFLVDQSTKGGTTGTLYGAGSFSAVNPVISGYTVTVTVTLTATAS